MLMLCRSHMENMENMENLGKSTRESIKALIRRVHKLTVIEGWNKSRVIMCLITAHPRNARCFTGEKIYLSLCQYYENISVAYRNAVKRKRGNLIRLQPYLLTSEIQLIRLKRDVKVDDEFTKT